MISAFNNRNVFVSFLAIVALAIAMNALAPRPSFADRIVSIHQYTTLVVGCNLGNNYDFAGATKVLTYDQPTKLTFNCDRPGSDVNLKQGESIALQCLHDNPLTTSKHVKMKAGELFYVLCNEK